MFLSFKFSNSRVAAVVIAVVLIVTVIFSVKCEMLSNASEDIYICKNTDDVSNYLSSFGLEVGSISFEEVNLPFEFNEVYENYNKIQQSQGFDLNDYKGKTVIRYSGEVYNYLEKEQDVFAEVLVFEGNVIAADIYSTDLSGFMVGLK